MTPKKPADNLTLQEAADRLGVHYMTAYRYVRLGKLPATKEGGEWRVAAEDVDRFGTPHAPASRTDWQKRLEERLVAGDEPGAWAIVEGALASTADAPTIYLEGLAPALRSIGDRWAAGDVTVATEHRASQIAARLMGRLGPMFSTRGRKKAAVVVGAASGDTHHLGGSMVADLLRQAHFDVHDLGADTPPESFAQTAAHTDAVAVGISVFRQDNEDIVQETIATVTALDPRPVVVVGGAAIRDQDHALTLGADGYATDAADAVATITRLVQEKGRA